MFQWKEISIFSRYSGKKFLLFIATMNENSIFVRSCGIKFLSLLCSNKTAILSILCSIFVQISVFCATSIKVGEGPWRSVSNKCSVTGSQSQCSVQYLQTCLTQHDTIFMKTQFVLCVTRKLLNLSFRVYDRIFFVICIVYQLHTSCSMIHYRIRMLRLSEANCDHKWKSETLPNIICKLRTYLNN
jgi:hypothetical protein